ISAPKKQRAPADQAAKGNGYTGPSVANATATRDKTSAQRGGKGSDRADAEELKALMALGGREKNKPGAKRTWPQKNWPPPSVRQAKNPHLPKKKPAFGGPF